MLKLCFYVPVTHLEAVKTAVFDAGAGRIGNYDACCWQTLGQGQFRPMAGSKPFIGSEGEVEQVEEYKVEMVCEKSVIVEVLKAFKAAHPYEEPAFDVMELLDL